MNFLHAKRYAQALFEYSEEKNVAKKIHEDLSKIYTLLNESADFVNFLENPAINSEKRIETIQVLFKGKLNALTISFFVFLEEKGRLFLLKEICEIFEHFYLKSENILKVNVTSSVKLNSSQMTSISGHLKERLGKDIELTNTVDEELVGGFKLNVGDEVHDYSIQSQLNKFKNRIIHY